MQLVQPSKFFSVTIFRTRSIRSIDTCANWGHVAIFSNAEKNLYSYYGSYMTMGVTCPLLRKPLVEIMLARFELTTQFNN